jgi:hypothetical protein
MDEMKVLDSLWRAGWIIWRFRYIPGNVGWRYKGSRKGWRNCDGRSATHISNQSINLIELKQFTITYFLRYATKEFRMVNQMPGLRMHD